MTLLLYRITIKPLPRIALNSNVVNVDIAKVDDLSDLYCFIFFKFYITYKGSKVL